MDQEKSLADIASIVEPQKYLDVLSQGKETLMSNLAQAVLDYDLTKNSPVMPEEAKSTQLQRLELLIRDIHWRLEEVERRIKAAQDGLRGQV